MYGNAVNVKQNHRTTPPQPTHTLYPPTIHPLYTHYTHNTLTHPHTTPPQPTHPHSDLEGDVVTLKSTATQLLHHMGCAGTPLSDEVVAEMVRYGAGELQCVAAVIGGMASQEAIKLLTRQFVPLHGTLLYNAVSSTTLLVVLCA